MTEERIPNCKRCRQGVMTSHAPEHSRYVGAAKCPECGWIDRNVKSLALIDKEEGWQGLVADAIISTGWEMNDE